MNKSMRSALCEKLLFPGEYCHIARFNIQLFGSSVTGIFLHNAMNFATNSDTELSMSRDRSQERTNKEVDNILIAFSLIFRYN
jgi:hypothetical protein